MKQIGLIGLGTMGANLARNAARNGAKVSVFNRTTEKTDAFMEAYGGEGEFVSSKTIDAFVTSLSTPRHIVLMVKAGEAVDEMIKELLPHLAEGDTLIDAGNSHYRDTDTRVASLAKKGIRFIGMGVSGGEEGALHGPSMMPGGSEEAYDAIRPLLEAMAADDGEGGKCVSFIGPGGSGHFVKTVHNGIEYGVMQLIAESYHLLRTQAGLGNAEIADVFAEWNEDAWLRSFLLDITVSILRTKDPDSGSDIVDVIKDAAAQKGTGKWTTDAAMYYGVAIPTVTAAVDARIISSAKDFRTKQSAQGLVTAHIEPSEDLPSFVWSALKLSIINTYAQGFQLLSAASDAEGWELSIPEIARIWQGGCIIRSDQLSRWRRVFAGDEKTAALVREQFAGDAQKRWREVVALGALNGIPLPALSASLSYYDACRTERLPQNIIQAQRDFFGAHGFERLDEEGAFHGSWGR